MGFRSGREIADGTAIELELVIVDELMIFHIRGHTKKVDAFEGYQLTVAPFDLKTRDIIVQYAAGGEHKGVRRRARRFATQLLVEFAVDGEFQKARAIDISQEGLFVESPVVCNAGTLVVLRIPIPGTAETLQLMAEVMWRGGAPRPGFGVKFQSSDEEKLKIIRKLCSTWVVT